MPQRHRVVIKTGLIEVLEAVVQRKRSVENLTEAANWIIADWAESHANEFGLESDPQPATPTQSRPIYSSYDLEPEEEETLPQDVPDLHSTRTPRQAKYRQPRSSARNPTRRPEPVSTKDAIQDRLRFLSES